MIAIRERYAGYLKRQDIEIESLHKSMRLSIPKDIDYMLINGLSNEAKERLLQIRPASLEQASRIPGMTLIYDNNSKNLSKKYYSITRDFNLI